MNMYEAMEEPQPQDYGFPANPSVVNQQCWDRQQAFLKAFGQLGTIRAAARTIGIHRSTVNLWLSTDLYSFKKRMNEAKEEYWEYLEDLIHERLSNPQGNRGSDVLLMFREKAEWPEKYREEVKVLGVSAPLQMLDKLRELAARDIKAREALEAPAIEGEFKEVGPIVQVIPPVPDNPGSRAPDPNRLASPQSPKRPKREPGRVKRR
jgi:hypothetical protein